MRIGFPIVGRQAEQDADSPQNPISNQQYTDDEEAQIYPTNQSPSPTHKNEADCECHQIGHIRKKPAFLNYIPHKSQQKGYDVFRYLLSTFVFAGLLLFVIFHITQVESHGCKGGQEMIVVQKGDTCWSIAESRGMTMDQMAWFNYGLVCENGLKPGVRLCVWETPD